MIEKVTAAEKAEAKEDKKVAAAARKDTRGKRDAKVEERFKLLQARFPAAGRGWQSPADVLPMESDASIEGMVWFVSGRDYPAPMPYTEVGPRGKSRNHYWCAWEDYVPVEPGTEEAPAT